MFNSTRSGDYISAAAALTRSMDEGYGASRASTSNFSDIAKTAIKTKSEERQVAINAANELAKQKNTLNTDLKLIKSNIKNQKEIANIKRPSQRFAGVVGAAASLSGAYMMKKQLDEDRADRLLLKQERDALNRRILESNESRNEADAALVKQLSDSISSMEERITSMETGVTDPPSSPKPNSKSSSTNNLSNSSTAPITSPNQTLPSYSFDPTKVMSKSDIESVALQAGFIPQNAKIATAISGGESSFDPSNSTKRSGLYKQTGEDSVGLMQINWGYHKDKGWLQDLGITKREQLLDPLTNMKAAKHLHSQYGDFRDWSVYNDGSYAKYL